MTSRTKGFTLLELIVAVSIYGIIMVAVLGSFWNLIRTRERADHFRNLQKELHFSMIKMADKIRAHSVDYGYYSDPAVSVDLSGQVPPGVPLVLNSGEEIYIENERLKLKDEAGMVFDLLTDRVKVPTHIPLKNGACIDGSIPETIPGSTDRGCRVQNHFQIFPAKDPFSDLADANIQLQPRVEIHFTLQDVHFPDLFLPIRTTISSRRYGR